MAQIVKNLPSMQETQAPSLAGEDPLEKGMATHSSILAWWIPQTDKPGGLLLCKSMGLQRVGHDWPTNIFTFIQLRASLSNIYHPNVHSHPFDLERIYIYQQRESRKHTSYSSPSLLLQVWTLSFNLSLVPPLGPGPPPLSSVQGHHS